jgi:hypothetical protein
VTATGAMLRQEVSKFMAQGPLNFERRYVDKFRIERDRFGQPAGQTGCCPESRIPLDTHLELGASGRT